MWHLWFDRRFPEQWGYPKLAGWFLLGKIQLTSMIWGVSPIYGHPHWIKSLEHVSSIIFCCPCSNHKCSPYIIKLQSWNPFPSCPTLYTNRMEKVQAPALAGDIPIPTRQSLGPPADTRIKNSPIPFVALFLSNFLLSITISFTIPQIQEGSCYS